MENISEGYKFTETELNILMKGAGFDDSHGIPMSGIQYSEEELIDAVNSLIRKKVLIPDGKAEYTMAEPFRTVFVGMRDCDKAVSFISANYSAWGYVCYPAISEEKDKSLAVWQIDLYVKNKFSLYILSAEEFCARLFEEEFVPAIAECCENIPSKLDSYVEESVENMKIGNDPVGIKPRLTAKLRNLADGDEKYLMVSRDYTGSYISVVSEGVSGSVGYTKEELRKKLAGLLEKGELV